MASPLAARWPTRIILRTAVRWGSHWLTGAYIHSYSCTCLSLARRPSSISSLPSSAISATQASPFNTWLYPFTALHLSGSSGFPSYPTGRRSAPFSFPSREQSPPFPSLSRLLPVHPRSSTPFFVLPSAACTLPPHWLWCGSRQYFGIRPRSVRWPLPLSMPSAILLPSTDLFYGRRRMRRLIYQASQPLCMYIP